MKCHAQTSKWELKNKIQINATYYFYYAYVRLNMFRAPLCPSSGNSSILPALNFHSAATREPDGLCGNQRYRREFLMTDIMVPETC
jgi:hypothetical protein